MRQPVVPDVAIRVLRVISAPSRPGAQRYANSDEPLLEAYRDLMRTSVPAHLSRVCVACSSSNHGQPRVLDADGRLLAHASVSHPPGWLALACSASGVRVGIDAEPASLTEFADEELDLWCTPAEIRAVRAGDALPVELWTRKEAVVKLLGTGLTSNLCEVDVRSGHVDALDLTRGVSVRSFRVGPLFLSLALERLP